MRFPHANTLLIVCFLIMWFWTEVSEYNERHTIYMEFKKFHDAGKRFTAEDGEAMQKQIDELKAKIE